MRSFFLVAAILIHGASLGQHLANTKPLERNGDIASQLVEGVDRFLLKAISEALETRSQQWNRNVTSRSSYQASIEPNIEELKRILGVIESDLTPELHIRSSLEDAPQSRVKAIQWTTLKGLSGEGLLMQPASSSAAQTFQQKTHLIAIPHAGVSAEQVAGRIPDERDPYAFARRFMNSGCQVYIPTLIDRAPVSPPSTANRGQLQLNHREFLHRSAFELGRTLTGYEVQKVLALVDWIDRQADSQASIGVFGYGDGGLIALCAAAIDPRIQAVGVSGYFGSKQRLWSEPIDRTAFGWLNTFGDAELATLVAPRTVIIESSLIPEEESRGGQGAPYQLAAPSQKESSREVSRALDLIPGHAFGDWIKMAHSTDGRPASPTTLQTFLDALAQTSAQPATEAERPRFPKSGARQRMERQIDEINAYNQALLVQSPYQRAAFMADVDTSSIAAFERSIAAKREFFRTEIIGDFDLPLVSPNPKTRVAYQQEKWTGYEVTLDVFQEVIAYGVLLLPNDLRPDEKRPVVVCQHGLEGRPQNLIEGDHHAYHDYAAKLADEGFIVFAPQNLYLFEDRFRTLQRKAYLLGKTLFSIITPQHQQILNWLKTLPSVDADRIAFYGLSYGGKTAMRVPALLDDYCLSICSADFNDWVWKNASSVSPYSYVWTGEYEIFEFNLGPTFNYAEMASLIAPRPFMVERGHFDGVAPDERVAAEYAKVRHLYAAKLGIPDRCEIEWFVGPHTINGQKTFDFLKKHLHWP